MADAPSFESAADRIQLHADQFEEAYLPDWPSYKSPYFKSTETPIGIMTKDDLSDDPRAWSHLRRCALAAPNGYSEGRPPVANWTNHYYDTQIPESHAEELDRLADGWQGTPPWEREPNQWERVKEQHDGDRYAFAWKIEAYESAKNRFVDYIEDDDETVAVSPPRMMELARNKDATTRYLEQADLPTPPAVRGDELLAMDDDEAAAELGDGSEGYFVQPIIGSHGNGTAHVETLEEAREYVDAHGAEDYICRTFIPHNSDIRALTVGDHLVNAMRRVAPEDEVCTNISTIDGEVGGVDLGVYGNAYNADRQGRAVSLDVDVYNEVSAEMREQSDRFLSPGPAALVDDVLDAFDPATFNYDPELPEKPFLVGTDIMEVDPDDITHLPEDVQEQALQYDDDTAYFVLEFNVNPGSMADLLARWHNRPEQITALHLAQLLKRETADNPFAVEAISGNPDNDIVGNDDHPLWRRIDNYYPQYDTVHDLQDTVFDNLKPYQREQILNDR